MLPLRSENTTRSKEIDKRASVSSQCRAKATNEWDLGRFPDVFAQDRVIQPQSWQENGAVCLLLYHQ